MKLSAMPIVAMLWLLLFPVTYLPAQTLSPKQSKQKAITTLQSVVTADKKLQHTIGKAIKAIEESLSHKGQSLFLDDFRLSPKHGELVFDCEKKAIELLQESMRHKDISPAIKVTFQQVIMLLREADKKIVEQAIALAQMMVQIGQGDVEKLSKAQREWENGLKEIETTKAVERFKHAWSLSQQVVENGEELVIADFSDSPDPWSPKVVPANILTVTLQIRKKGELIEELREDKKQTQFLLELVEVIKDSANTVVRTIKSRQALVVPFPEAKQRFITISLTSNFDGKSDAGVLLADGSYSYLAFVNLIKFKHEDKKNSKERIEAMSFPIQGYIVVDATAPVITAATNPPSPNEFGWFRQPVDIRFSASDNLSGLASLNPESVVISTEGKGQIIVAKAIDRAKNEAQLEVVVNIDVTPASIIASQEPPKNDFGWNNTSVRVSFVAEDLLSGVYTVSQEVILTQEAVGQLVEGTVTDFAGNRATVQHRVSIDKTPGTITASLSPKPNLAGWSTSDTTIHFEAFDALSGIAFVSPDITITQEGIHSNITGIVRDKADNVAETQISLRLDKTKPILALSPVDGQTVMSDKPSFVATYGDNLSGIDLASLKVYLTGQDITANFTKAQGQATFTPSTALPSGQHTWSAQIADVAGNIITANATFQIAIGEQPDTTPPVLTLSPGDGSVINTSTPQLKVSFSDDRAGINLASLRIILNGEDITARFTKLSQGASFTTSTLADGTYRWEVTIADNNGNTVSRTATLVIATDASQTFLRGKVANTQANPVAGIIVQLDGVSTVTNVEGIFQLSATPGNRFLQVDGRSLGLALIRLMLEIKPGANNLPREIFLPTVPLEEKGIPISQTDKTILTNPDFPGFVIEIAAASVKNPDGSNYLGKMMVLSVPAARSPFVLPVDLEPDLEILVQPGGMLFTTPAIPTIPNTVGYPEGAILDLWALSPNPTGTQSVFAKVGKGKVQGGQIITIEGGLLRSGCLYFLPSQGVGKVVQNSKNKNPNRGCGICGNSLANVTTGNLNKEHSLPAVRFLGQSFAPKLTYNSNNAFPNEIIAVDMDYSRVTRPTTFRNKLIVDGLEIPGLEYTVDGVSGSEFRFAQQVDLTQVNTGVLNIAYAARASYGNAAVTSRTDNLPLLVNNQSTSPFGAGWTLEGIQRLSVLPSRDLLLLEGNGSALFFLPLVNILSPLPTPRGALVAETLADGIHVISGGREYDGGTRYTAHEVYDPEKNSWTTRAPMLGSAVWDPASAVVDGKIYVIGGWGDYSYLNREYDPLTDTWRYRARVPEEWGDGWFSNGHIAAVVKGEIYVIGGALTAAYNPQTNTWSRGATIPSAGAGGLGKLAAGVINDKIYVVSIAAIRLGGGYVVGWTTELQIYNPATNTWTQGASLPMSLTAPSAVSFQGKLYVFGGSDFPNKTVPLNDVHIYDPITDQWQVAFKKLPTKRAWSAAAVYRESAFIFGGFDMAIWEKLAVSANERFPLLTQGAQTFQSPAGDFSTLVRNEDDTFTRTLKDGTKIHFNAQGLQTSIVDRNGNTFTYQYQDANGDGKAEEIASITMPVGTQFTFSYTAGKLSSVSDPAGRITYFIVNGSGDLVEIINPDGTRRRFTYSSKHLLISQISERGFETRYEFDAFSRISKSHLPDGSVRDYRTGLTAGLVEPTSSEGTTGNPVLAPLSRAVVSVYTDSLGRPQQSRADSLGGITETEDSLGNVSKTERDANSLPTKITDALGRVTTMTYDQRGNLLTTTQVDTGATTRMEYEPNFNQPTKITDPLGRVTQMVYDEKGNLLKIFDALNHQTTLTYNSQGLVVLITDALDRTTTMGYDTLGNLVSVRDPLGNTTTYTSDSGAGNLLVLTDALGHSTFFTYDFMNRMVFKRDALEGVTRWEYNEHGDIVSITDANNNKTSLTYSSCCNRLASTTDPLGATTTVSYDANGNILSLTDPLGKMTYRQYNELNQLTAEIRKVGDTLPTPDLDDVVTTFAYDALGNRVKIVDGNGRVTYQKFDTLNRLVKVIRKVGDSADIIDSDDAVTSYNYDLVGNALSINLPNGITLSRSYDALNRVKTQTNGAGETTSLEYDLVGNILRVNAPNGNVTNL